MTAATPREWRLTERDWEVLSALEFVARRPDQTRHGKGWVKSLDVGGSNGSHHSYTLQKLWRYGLADRRKNGVPFAPGRKSRIKGSDYYKITASGIAAVAERRVIVTPEEQ